MNRIASRKRSVAGPLPLLIRYLVTLANPTLIQQLKAGYKSDHDLLWVVDMQYDLSPSMAWCVESLDDLPTNLKPAFHTILFQSLLAHTRPQGQHLEPPCLTIQSLLRAGPRKRQRREYYLKATTDNKQQ